MVLPSQLVLTDSWIQHASSNQIRSDRLISHSITVTHSTARCFESNATIYCTPYINACHSRSTSSHHIPPLPTPSCIPSHPTPSCIPPHPVLYPKHIAFSPADSISTHRLAAHPVQFTRYRACYPPTVTSSSTPISTHISVIFGFPNFLRGERIGKIFTTSISSDHVALLSEIDPPPDRTLI